MRRRLHCSSCRGRLDLRGLRQGLQEVALKVGHEVIVVHEMQLHGWEPHGVPQHREHALERGAVSEEQQREMVLA